MSWVSDRVDDAASSVSDIYHGAFDGWSLEAMAAWVQQVQQNTINVAQVAAAQAEQAAQVAAEQSRADQLAVEAKGAYDQVAETKAGQIGIAVLSNANPISASVQGALSIGNLAPVVHGVFSSAQETGALNNLATSGAREEAASTFGPYFVAGANAIAPGSGTAAVKLAGETGIFDDVPFIKDLVNGFFGPDAQTDTPVLQSDAPPASADVKVADGVDMTPLLLLAIGATGALILIIYLRR